MLFAETEIVTGAGFAHRKKGGSTLQVGQMMLHGLVPAAYLLVRP